MIQIADDTNIEAIRCSQEYINDIVNIVTTWLKQNKFVSNLEKTVYLNTKTESPKQFKLNQETINFKPDNVRKRLPKQCGNIAKLRHYVPRKTID